ncbi:hypothetical protein C8J25_1115 [Sphingomonas faeni]|uniref:Thymidylate kinase n=1 Tax=Sphingomonas faeni TaxID=185950 RepID=A0A2T5TY28_9SPHN|nr:hypothetical protein [Sphingomonas faeni]PTW44170.1 hypothetical protein C8J25_1115 [Sphingomonas faeni]
MIVVVEGISASGKSTWCARHGGSHVVPENGRLAAAPDRVADPAGAAAFWAERNIDRWQAALAVEHSTGHALCDTDPLKLHYVWCLWRIGEASERDWSLELAATRQTIADGRIGFADRYLVADTDVEAARRQAIADPRRRRRNFDIHARLRPALLEWYAALDVVLPGRVQFGLPANLSVGRTAGQRYDIATFDEIIARLPQSK